MAFLQFYVKDMSKIKSYWNIPNKLGKPIAIWVWHPDLAWYKNLSANLFMGEIVENEGALNG